MTKDDEIRKDLMKHYELIWNAHHHTERQFHYIFYILTGLIISCWTISIQLKPMLYIEKFLILAFSTILAFFGLYLTYNFQYSNDEAHVLLNRIRDKLKHGKLRYGRKKLFPTDWEKYCLEEITDHFPNITRFGIKSTAKWSWWAIFKFSYWMLFFIGVTLSTKSLLNYLPMSLLFLVLMSVTVLLIIILYFFFNEILKKNPESSLLC